MDCTSLLYSMIDGFIKSCVHLADRMTGPAREEEEILLLQACHNCHRNICCDSVSPTSIFPGFCSQIYAVGSMHVHRMHPGGDRFERSIFLLPDS